MHKHSADLARAACSTSAAEPPRVAYRAPGCRLSGGGAFSLGRVGVPAPGRTRGGQNPRAPAVGREANWLVLLHTFGVGGQPGLRQSGAMPPCSLQRSLRKLRVVQPGWLALAAPAAHNRSAKTDRVTAGFACLRASACLQR